MHVLIVDDDKSVQDTLKLVVKDLDHCVTIARNGAMAIGLLANKSLSYDAVITDVQMRDGNGLEVLQFVAADTSPLPFYVHSMDDTFEIDGNELDLPSMVPLAFPFAVFRKKDSNTAANIGAFLESVEKKTVS